MKKLFKIAMFAIALMAASTAVNAQKTGDMSVDANLVFGTDDGPNIGIAPKFQYNITDPIRLEGSFTYFLEEDYVSMWDLTVAGHYLFPMSDALTLYPFV